MKVLGLDLGVGSIGWALIEIDNNTLSPLELIAMGVRAISLTPDDTKSFTSNKGETPCARRTTFRTARKSLDRYQLRRAQLRELLKDFFDSDNQLLRIPPLQLWKLRSDAATEGHRLTLNELARVLLHINQRRGYRHSKSDGDDSSKSAFVNQVKNLHTTIKADNLTPGQYFYRQLSESAIQTDGTQPVATYRVKEKILPRQAYIDEVRKILDVQATFYPEIITDDFKKAIEETIFYQRPLKSCKHLISVCEFEKRTYLNKDGKEVVAGPKVAHRSAPIVQMARLLETVNNIRLSKTARYRRQDKNAKPKAAKSPVDPRLEADTYTLNADERRRVFDYLNTHDKLTSTKLLEILGLKKSDGFKPDDFTSKGIKGNETYCLLHQALEGVDNRDDLLKFDIELTDSGKIDTDTGEVLREVSPSFVNQPLHRLWHIVYSVSDRDELAKAIERNFGISDPDVIDRLFSIDFQKYGFASRSTKFIRKLIPYLMQGHVYSEAATIVGVNHSDSITAEENAMRELQPRLRQLVKGELRQPIVERVINQMINICNALKERYGEIDDVRVELARELKQSKQQRMKSSESIASNERTNQTYAKILTEHGLRASRRNIQKYHLWEETGKKCIYCNAVVGMAEFMGGDGGEIEHIIPKSLLFDDSLTNKVCACRECNRKKAQTTGYDFMASQSDDALNGYLERVEALYAAKKISRLKRERLLTKHADIPTDFLERDLRQSQYIAKKAREILRESFRNVYATSGRVTDFFRHQWGYDMILHNLNIDRYAKAGLAKEETFEHKGQKHSATRIEGWSKRLDHRHHAIDALVIALTRQGYIQRLNNLSAQHDSIYEEFKTAAPNRTTDIHLVEDWGATRPHFTTADVSAKAEDIAISFRAGKRLTTSGKCTIRSHGKKRVVQTDIIVPRGPLHEATVYGIRRVADDEKTIRYALEHPHLIHDTALRQQLRQRLAENNHDIAATVKSLNKKPLLTSDGTPIKKIACDKEECVTRYAVETLTPADIEFIVDKGIREAVEMRFKECDNNVARYKKSLSEAPILIGKKRKLPVRKVTCRTGLNPEKMANIVRDHEGATIGVAKFGSNHHVAFYKTPDNKVETSVVPFLTAVKRRKSGLAPIITNPREAADSLIGMKETPDTIDVIASLPDPSWHFIGSLQLNEMFILGLSSEQIDDARRSGNTALLTSHLYRVQALSMNDYRFRLHTDTSSVTDSVTAEMKTSIRILSFKTLTGLHPLKVKVSSLGEIIFDND